VDRQRLLSRQFGARAYLKDRERQGDLQPHEALCNGLRRRVGAPRADHQSPCAATTSSTPRFTATAIGCEGSRTPRRAFDQSGGNAPRPLAEGQIVSLVSDAEHGVERELASASRPSRCPTDASADIIRTYLSRCRATTTPSRRRRSQSRSGQGRSHQS
jgi:hypothetical protein